MFDDNLSQQADLNATRDSFADHYSEDPKKDDLTILAPKQDDPTDQAS